MQIRFTSRGNTLIAVFAGELDHHSAEYLRHKLDMEIIKATVKNVVFDFSKLVFMDSSGIGVIIGRYRNLQKLKGKLAIAGASITIKRILEMSGVNRLVPLFASVGEALEWAS